MKEKIGQKFGQLKEAAGKLSDKTKKLIIAGVVVLIAGAVIIALVLNNRPYGSLFTGLGQEEAQQITKKLQEDGIDFKYDGDSEILVRIFWIRRRHLLYRKVIRKADLHMTHLKIMRAL